MPLRLGIDIDGVLADFRNAFLETARDCLRREVASESLTDDSLSDDGLWFGLEQHHIGTDRAITEILNSTVCRALAYYDFALQTGEAALVTKAKNWSSCPAICRASIRWWPTSSCRSLAFLEAHPISRPIHSRSMAASSGGATS